MNSIPFEMVRLTKSKREVDVSPNTIRKLARDGGLNIYRVGKAAFFSRLELAELIRHRTPLGVGRSLPS